MHLDESHTNRDKLSVQPARGEIRRGRLTDRQTVLFFISAAFSRRQSRKAGILSSLVHLWWLDAILQNGTQTLRVRGQTCIGRNLSTDRCSRRNNETERRPHVENEEERKAKKEAESGECSGNESDGAVRYSVGTG